MFNDFAFFPQLFAPNQTYVKWNKKLSSDRSFAEDAYRHMLENPGVNAFGVSTFTWPNSLDIYEYEYEGDLVGVSASAPGNLLDDHALSLMHKDPGWTSPPPCEGTYIKMTNNGESPPVN